MLASRASVGDSAFTDRVPAPRAMLADLALAAAIRGALKSNEITQDVNVDIEAADRKVVLRGIVLNDQEREDSGRIAGSVEGVDGVDNRLQVMSVYRRFTQART